MTITQIVLGTLPLMLTILGAAIHLGVRIGRFQQALLGVEKIQETIANDLVTHMSHDEKLFGELNSLSWYQYTGMFLAISGIILMQFHS